MLPVWTKVWKLPVTRTFRQRRQTVHDWSALYISTYTS